MHRSIGLSFCCCALVLVGCAQLRNMMGGQNPTTQPHAMSKPAQPEEMKKLQRFVGDWEGTAEMVSPSPAEMSKHMPEGKEMQSTFQGGGKTEWALDGMALRSEGWHDMGEGQKAHMIEFWTWDPRAKKYRLYFMSDWGETGTGWATPDEDGNTYRMTGTATDASGKRKKFDGTMRVIDDNTIEWTWNEKGPMGKMQFKGTSKRKA